MNANHYSSPDIINRLRDSGVFKSSPHGQPNHIILNEVSTLIMYKPINDSLQHIFSTVPAKESWYVSASSGIRTIFTSLATSRWTSISSCRCHSILRLAYCVPLLQVHDRGRTQRSKCGTYTYIVPSAGASERRHYHRLFVHSVPPWVSVNRRSSISPLGVY